MASRKFQQFRLSIIPQVVELWARVRCPTPTGAPLLSYWNPVTQQYSDATTVGNGGDGGVVSVARAGVGLWNVTFGSGSPFNANDIYRRWLDVEVTTYNPTGIPTVIAAGVVTGVGAVAANNGNTTNNGGFVSSNILQIQLSAVSGAASDPAANDTLVFRFTAQNSSSK